VGRSICKFFLRLHSSGIWFKTYVELISGSKEGHVALDRANREIINEAVVRVNINFLYLSVAVRKCSPLKFSQVTLGFCYSLKHFSFGATLFQDFPSLLGLNGSNWNRGLMRRWFITWLCHRHVAVCNLKNVIQYVVALSK
jgi:hypothetical protein